MRCHSGDLARASASAEVAFPLAAELAHEVGNGALEVASKHQLVLIGYRLPMASGDSYAHVVELNHGGEIMIARLCEEYALTATCGAFTLIASLQRSEARELAVRLIEASRSEEEEA
jgi:hypothetical protein